MLYVRRRERAGRGKNRTLFLGRFSSFEVAKCAEAAPWYAEIDPSARAGLIRYLEMATKKRTADNISPADDGDHNAGLPEQRPLVVMRLRKASNVRESQVAQCATCSTGESCSMTAVLQSASR